MTIAHFYKMDKDKPTEHWGAIINGNLDLQEGQEMLVKMVQRNTGKEQGHKAVRVVFVKEDGPYGPFALAELEGDCTEEEYTASVAQPTPKTNYEPF